MGMINRRNAVVGWAVWTVGKQVLKRKAKQALPAVDTGRKRPNRSLVVLALAGAAAAAWFWFRRSDDDDTFGP